MGLFERRKQKGEATIEKSEMCWDWQVGENRAVKLVEQRSKHSPWTSLSSRVSNEEDFKVWAAQTLNKA